jgi:transposase
MSGDIFIFINKQKGIIKLLIWDSNGFAIWYKKWEKEILEEWNRLKTLRWNWPDLVMRFKGIDLSSIKRRKRYQKVG